MNAVERELRRDLSGTSAESTRLRKENAKLRSALQTLVAMNNCQYDRETADYRTAMETAKAALATR
jgi:hypothetical protein